jgi:hypothetical protein
MHSAGRSHWESTLATSRNGRVEVTDSSTPVNPTTVTSATDGDEGGLVRQDNGAPRTMPQDRANLPACRQYGQPDVSDPLTMRSESADPDTKSALEARASDKDSGSSGLSQVLGKVLQQLSISAWVPAAVLVGNAAVLLQLHEDGSYNIAHAVKQLAGKPLGTIIILIFALILATVVTQAFEFEVIRLLEGYFDSTHGFVQAMMAARIRRHEHKQQRLLCKLREANRDACAGAVARMRQYPDFRPAVLDFLLHGATGGNGQASDEVAEMAKKTDWKPYAPPAMLYRIDSAAARLGSYPQENRLLPTRLGNVLRAAEDKVELGPNENIQGFVVRYHDQLSPALRSEHKDYRTRLDMYCCLVLVFSMLAVISIAALISISPVWGTAIAVTVYVLMTYVSYEAAIASARGYGLILQEISHYLARQNESTEASGSSALAGLLALLHRKAM